MPLSQIICPLNLATRILKTRILKRNREKYNLILRKDFSSNLLTLLYLKGKIPVIQSFSHNLAKLFTKKCHVHKLCNITDWFYT